MVEKLYTPYERIKYLEILDENICRLVDEYVKNFPMDAPADDLVALLQEYTDEYEEDFWSEIMYDDKFCSHGSEELSYSFVGFLEMIGALRYVLWDYISDIKERIDG